MTEKHHFHIIGQRNKTIGKDIVGTKEMEYVIKLFTVILSFSFLVHLFVLERHRNGFVEYDQHFLPSVLLLISCIILIKSFAFALVNYRIKMDSLSILGILFLSYILIRFLISQPFSFRNMILPVVLLCLFFLYRNEGGKMKQMTLYFVLAALIVAMVDIGNFQLIKSEYFLKDAAKINTGENANYYASVIPFIFSLLLAKRPATFSKWLNFVLCTIVLLICLYILGKSNSRTAIIAAFCGFIYVFFRLPAVQTTFKKVKTRVFLTIAALLLIIAGSIFIGKYLYNRNPKSVQGRLFIYEVTAGMIAQRPIWGYGPQSFKKEYNLHQSNYISTHNVPMQKRLLADDCCFAFNEFLQVCAELGIVGLCMVLLALFYCVTVAMKNNLNRFEVGAVGALLSIVLCALFSYPLHTTSVLVNTIFFLAILSNRLPAKLFIRLNRPGSIAFLCFFLVLSTGFSFKEWRRMQALKNWEVAAHIALVDGFSKADIYYNSAVDELFNEGVFLYNYGAEAYVADRYEQSLILLQRAILFHSSGDLYVYLGDLLRTLKQYSSAEAAYKVAENIQPSRFLPKIQLLNLYQQKGEKEKGLRQARVIIDFPVKIPSPTADEYKKMAHDFLEKENVR